MIPIDGLPARCIARWSARRDEPPAYECAPCVPPEATDASMDEAVFAQNGTRIDARSGVCLLIAVYVPGLKLGGVIHLNRNKFLWPEQRELIQAIFTRFPQLGDHPRVAFVSSKDVEAEQSDMALQAKNLIRELAPTARIEDLWVNSLGHPDCNREALELELLAMELPMSVEICLGTACGKLLILDDYGLSRTIDLLA